MSDKPRMDAHLDPLGVRSEKMTEGVPTAGAMARLTALTEERRAFTGESFAEAWKAITGESDDDGRGVSFGESYWTAEPKSHIRHVAARRIVNTEGIPYELAFARVRRDVREAIEKTSIIKGVNFSEAEEIVYTNLAK